MVVTLLLVIWAGSAACDEAASRSSQRSAKSLAYFTGSFLNGGPPSVVLDDFGDYSDPSSSIPSSSPLGDSDLTGGSSVEDDDVDDGNELSARARPLRPRPDSPVYYIRLPPSPYMLVPGVGYVSRPPTLRPPPVVQPRPPSQFINLPINFVSNGKPTSVYTWKQDSPITHLDKGPYNFNSRPTDLFLLRNTYNSLYDDALQNFYP